MISRGHWVFLFLACLSLLMADGRVNGGKLSGRGFKPLTLHWNQEFRFWGGGYSHGVSVQYFSRRASGTATESFDTSGFETWWGRLGRPIHRSLAMNLTRSSSASDTILVETLGGLSAAFRTPTIGAIPGGPDLLRLRLGWRFLMTWNDTPVIFLLIWLHPGTCVPETTLVKRAGPLHLFGFPASSAGWGAPIGAALLASPEPFHQPPPHSASSGRTGEDHGSQPVSDLKPADSPSGGGDTSPGSPTGSPSASPSPNQGGSGHNSGVGAAAPMGGEPRSEPPKPGTVPVDGPPQAPLVIPSWVALLLILFVLLLTLVSAGKLWKGRRKAASRLEPLAPSGEKQVDAYSRIHSSLAEMQEHECQERLEQYFAFLDREPSLLETEAARLRLLLEQTASRLAARQYEPGSNGGNVRDMEQAHASLWRHMTLLLGMPEKASFWRTLIDASWEPQLVKHMVRALHFLEQGRKQPLLGLKEGLLAILQASPETAMHVGLEGFLQGLSVALKEGTTDSGAGFETFEVAGKRLPPEVQMEWKRIGEAKNSGKALLAHLESKGIIIATLNLLRNGQSGPLRMHAVHVPPRPPAKLPTIAFFHLEPTSSRQVLRSRMKGFNLAIAIRHDDDGHVLLMRNRNTDDTFHFPITDDTAQEMGRLSQLYGGLCTLALIDAQDIGVTFLPRHETPLDPTGETWRILKMIRDGNVRAAIARWQPLPPHGAPLSDVWLELVSSQCNSLRAEELGMAKNHIQGALQRRPDSWQALSAMGIICRREGRDIEALEFFARAYKAFPYDVSNLVCYASLLLASPDERTNDLIRNLAGLAFDLNPRSAIVLRLLADLEEAGIASRAYFNACALDSRIQG